MDSVLSFGARNCLKGPSVYMRTSGHATFLQDNVCRMTQFPETLSTLSQNAGTGIRCFNNDNDNDNDTTTLNCRLKSQRCRNNADCCNADQKIFACHPQHNICTLQAMVNKYNNKRKKKS